MYVRCTDNLVERLQQTPVPIVRLGHPVRVLPKVMESTLEAILERSEATKLANDVRADVNRLLKSLKVEGRPPWNDNQARSTP